ncbi:putative ribonuclease H-like domain-containing protein, partial [Tanacetum coccineum]
NENSFKPAAQTTTNANGTSPGLVTTKENVQKKNDVKARSMLLMALLNEHLMTFNQYKDAKTLFAAIQTRFGGNEATKKTQKTLLKQIYENFSAPNIESLDSIFNKLQKINMAFVSSPSSTNEVNTANLSDDIVYAFLASQPNGSQLVYEDLKQIHEDDIKRMGLKWQLALLSMRTRSYMADDEVPTNMALIDFLDFELLIIRGLASEEEQLVFYKKNKVIFCEKLVVLKRDISYKDSELSMLKSELEKLKQEKESNQLKIEIFNNASKSLDKLIGSQITDKSRKGVGFVSYNIVPPPHIGLFSPPNLDLSYSGLEEFQQHEFEGYGPKPSKSVSKDTSNEVRESPDASLVKELASDDKLEKKTVFPTIAKIEFVRPKQQEKPVRKPVKYAEMYRSQSPSFDHVQADCNYHQRERVVSGNNYTRVNYNCSAKKTHPSAYRNMVPRAVLIKTGLRSLNTTRPVNIAHPKTTVYSARPMSCFSKSAQSTVKRPYQIRTALTNKKFSSKANTAKGKFYTARPKAFNTARANSVVVNAVRANQVNVVKDSASWVWRPIKLNSASITLKRHNYVDARGRSKSNSRNLMVDMLPLDEEPKEGKLLVKELLKLICDKKNCVLFTDIECFVLSLDFKLADESQATLDESMLWHRRLGHVNFKTIHKLVKENLVRGLPIKRFENDQTCVACLKGKQHKASFEHLAVLAYASFKDFVVYQMDVKSAFLYGKIEEEVYVYQPPGFEDPDFPDKVYKVEKALYGLHQALRASDVADLLSQWLFDVGRFEYLTVTANDAIQVSVVGLTYYWYQPLVYSIQIGNFCGLLCPDRLLRPMLPDEGYVHRVWSDTVGACTKMFLLRLQKVERLESDLKQTRKCMVLLYTNFKESEKVGESAK